MFKATPFLLLALLGALRAPSAQAQKYLRADGVTDTYTLLNNVLGGSSMEVPDCKHNMKHIWQGYDGTLQKQVFFFNLHTYSDDDRCMNSDRQRCEIKTNKGEFQAYNGETISYSWGFRLDAAFQPSTSFTHIHQLKAVDGYDKQPLITITPRKGSPDQLEVIHVDSSDKITKIGTTALAPFLGVWVHVVESATYGTSGSYSVRITRVSDGAQLLQVSRSGIDMWRPDTSYIRGKWGLYRSLANVGQLRDESLRISDICLAKGSQKCY